MTAEPIETRAVEDIDEVEEIGTDIEEISDEDEEAAGEVRGPGPVPAEEEESEW